MTLAKVKTDEERARLDAIFAEIEAMERGEIPQKEDSRTPAQIAEDNRRAKIDRLGQEIEIKDFNLMYNVECASGFHFFRTRKEAEEY